ncbi:M14 family metallopeptidase [Paucibacter sp. DJ1R-11]|uniref:M14 family metallopeptidase n=1 Tax=Paucibacter sp. DJ1R-11 TaxID=2893556 RepID=UPI0021E4A613|nr:M14 family metallopeptidase [Paucibacter sp. DJ1R-11]MCV2365681.1 M14 family metallopeptidase [Paucibacter sp. DJ1R-11]
MAEHAEAFFAQSYAEARAKFLAAAEAAGLDVESRAHPLLGREGEALALDVLRQGPARGRAERLLILSSACHGVEGFAGSGIQCGLLADPQWLAAVRASGVCVLYLHGLNPHGFSWWRRVTQEGVDLNRNFVDFHQRPLPANPGYEELASALLPRQWPPSAENEARLSDYIARHGRAAWQQAVSGGQYTQELGLFYGGHTPTWSHITLRHVLEEHLVGVRELAWIDLHTGLGPCGHGERIYTGQDTGESLARARQWWGAGVTSLSEGNSSSAPLVGLMWSIVEPVFAQVAPGARYTGMALEFGTVPLDEMILALRADHWLEAHPEAPPEQVLAIKRQIRDAFYIDTPAWKAQLLAQASEAAHQALAGLNSGSPLSSSPT